MLIRPASKTGRIHRPGPLENAFLLFLFEKQYFKKTVNLILPNREALTIGKIREEIPPEILCHLLYGAAAPRGISPCSYTSVAYRLNRMVMKGVMISTRIQPI